MILAFSVALAVSLYDQSLVKLLHERYSEPRLSYILVEAQEGAVVDARWPDSNSPVVFGSVMKVFTALAYGASHDSRFPSFNCAGSSAGCWLPRGHGRIGIAEAIAGSCNAYFDALARELSPGAMEATAARLGIAPPPETPAAWVGRAGLWKVAPLDLARALLRLHGEPGAAPVLEGMRQCALKGTGRAIGAALAKTGTAPCTHSPQAPGDGFVVLLDGAEPRYVLVVRVHGVPGSEAAVLAGAMLRLVRGGR